MTIAPPSTEAELPPVSGLSFQNKITPVSGTLRPQSIALLGKHKTGKTSLAASMSEVKSLVKSGKKVLILESESGTASIAEDFPNVDMFKLATFNGLRRTCTELLTEDHPYGVVVFDTADKFQEYAVGYHVDGAANTQAGWGEVKKWLNTLIWDFHKSNILAIFIFHEQDEKNEKTGAVLTTFKLQGSSKNDIGQIFDIIGRLDVRQFEDAPHRFLQLGPAEGQVTGSRYESKLPNLMMDPTFDKIFDLILAPSAKAVAAKASKSTTSTATK